MSETGDLLAANERYAAAFERGDLPAPPAKHVAVLTCMDARIDPQQLLGLDLGDAHIIRNAGGRASDDALRSLVISSLLLGTREIMVIHHTRCGMATHSNAETRRKLRESTGADASGVDFLFFQDLEDSVRDDVHRIRHSPLIASDVTVHGYIYDVQTGRLAPVAGAAA